MYDGLLWKQKNQDINPKVVNKVQLPRYNL